MQTVTIILEALVLEQLLLQNAELSFKGNDAPLLAKANIVLSVSLSLELLGGISKTSALHLAYDNVSYGYLFVNCRQSSIHAFIRAESM